LGRTAERIVGVWKRKIDANPFVSLYPFPGSISITYDATGEKTMDDPWDRFNKIDEFRGLRNLRLYFNRKEIII
jgi:hypothetical protein